jgi:hypothetical protein
MHGRLRHHSGYMESPDSAYAIDRGTSIAPTLRHATRSGRSQDRS